MCVPKSESDWKSINKDVVLGHKHEKCAEGSKHLREEIPEEAYIRSGFLGECHKPIRLFRKLPRLKPIIRPLN